MLDDVEATNLLPTAAELNRRRLFQRAGAGLAGAAAVSALSAGGMMLGSQSASAATTTGPDIDGDIFNFALNLEYLEAEFYLRGIGQNLAQYGLTSGSVGTQGVVTGGTPVPFQSAAIQQYVSRIAVDELSHVRFIRAVLGSGAIAEPSINLSTSFTTLARAAGLINSTQTFDPFADEISFLLGASIFEDVGVTAYAGAARYITNPDYLEAAGGILAVEAYHSGAIRTLLADLGAGQAFDAISDLRGALSAQIVPGAPAEQRILITDDNYNFVATDSNGLAFRRSTAQVLNIVYGGGAASGYLFFPNKTNGTIS